MSRLDGVLLGYLPYEGLVELKSVGSFAAHIYPLAPVLRRATTAEPGMFVKVIGKLVRLHLDPEVWQVERIEELRDE